MIKGSLEPELQLLLHLSHPSCTTKTAQVLLENIPANFNWAYFLERAIATHLAGYLLRFQELANEYYPPFVLQKIIAYQQRILLHSTLLREALLEIAALLNQKDIPFAVLKGWDSHFRRGISLKERQISDIDLFIEPIHLIELQKIFLEKGYIIRQHLYKSKYHAKWLPTHAPLMAQKNEVIFDIHTSSFAAEHKIKFRIDLKKRSQIPVTQQTVIYVLNEQEANYFMSLHLLKHLRALHAFKAAQIIDILHLSDSDTFMQNNEYRLPKRFQEFISAYRSLQLDPKKIYDRFFLLQLAGVKTPFLIKLLKLLRRISPKTNLLKSSILFVFDLFPNKIYLEKRYGNRSYLRMNFIRLVKRLPTL